MKMKTNDALQVPESLKAQLLDYRRRVWRIKLIEAVSIALFGLGAAFLIVYGWDRLANTPRGLRTALLLGSVLLTGIVPWFVMRWLVRYRKLESVAQLLAKKMPSVGDQLLGVIELTHSDSEQARSLKLCQAAMRQVADDAASRDFNSATPPSRYRTWACLAAAVAMAILVIAIVYPAASRNALSRFAAPWTDTPRYTFTRIEPIDDQVVIAHGEPASLPVRLTESSHWQPATAELSIGGQTPIQATLAEGGYQFQVPPQINQHPMRLRVGDLIREVTLKPMLRPELSSIVAQVQLPEYLGRPQAQSVDSRAGRVTLVRGSKTVVTATANRELRQGQVNEQPSVPSGASLSSDRVTVDKISSLKFQWQDRYGLSGREPFELSVEAIDDEAPTLIVDGLPRQAVVLASEMLKFEARASDDFGVRRVGLMWRGLDSRFVEKIAEGEKPLAAGGHESTELDVLGTFSAQTLGIQPQPIELFVWAEDYSPERDRIYSPPHVLYILTPDQHAIWMTEQLSKWHRQALDVRDRERQLYEENKKLRGLEPRDLDLADNRRAVQRQASAERSNGRRLDRLGKMGDQLIQSASRNPEIGVGHLERWAEMLQVLKDLSENRMPSVADLLDDASKSHTKIAAGPTSPGGPKAGQVRAGGGGPPAQPDPDAPPKLRSAPQLVDMESSANSPDDQPGNPGPPKKPSSPSLRLPVTTVMGKSSSKEDPPPNDQQQQIQQAVEEQADLLAEFDKLADEMNAVLANLEGSTLVKRLKAASRVQNLVAGKLTEQLEPAFGVRKAHLVSEVREELAGLQDTEQASSKTISYIMDDLSAYFERRRFMQFKATLDEMKSSDILGGIRKLSTDIASLQGVSVAQCEYWADSLDRWAENLVDPACSGSCPGGKSPESLPPSIVLEVLQILEAEINLREETRVAEQAKAAIKTEEHEETAQSLATIQSEIDDRVVKVIARIRELTDATKHFRKELAMLGQVDNVMAEASQILAQGETGPSAIAAETEAIELMLRSKRINPKGGGGGGASPGSGGGGNTVDSALALVGKGRNQKEVRQERGVTQTTGETGTVLPEEFRHGLDQYFSRLGGS
jgi:hypothetical protein